MLKYLPFVVVAIAMVPLTWYQWQLLDWVWGENTPAIQCAYLLESEIPREFGDWVGEDRAVDPEILEVAGADGYIDRTYTNQKTNEQVSIWFIVGHFRQVSRHTPNFCYRAAGFDQVEPVSVHRFQVADLPTSEFRTAKFMANDSGRQLFQRVFWAWWKPEPLKEGQSPDDVNVVWTAPEEPRIGFGYCRALYKLYFTAHSDAEERPEESVCLKFASEFLPIVHERLRESGLVMANEVLPDDVEQVLKRMQDSNQQQGGSQPADEAPDAAAREEDEPPADTENDAA